MFISTNILGTLVFIVDVYGMIIVLNEVLTGRKPADDCHSPRTAALKNVLHTAGSLPLQICGGIRPYLYDGERFHTTHYDGDISLSAVPILANLSISTHEASKYDHDSCDGDNRNNQFTLRNDSKHEDRLPVIPVNPNSITKKETSLAEVKTNNIATNSAVTPIPSDMIHRIQHLIRAGWSIKPNDRPVAKGVVTTIRNILKFLTSSESATENTIDYDAEVTELSNKFMSILQV